ARRRPRAGHRLGRRHHGRRRAPARRVEAGRLHHRPGPVRRQDRARERPSGNTITVGWAERAWRARPTIAPNGGPRSPSSLRPPYRMTIDLTPTEMIMAKYKVEDIRNLALVGHRASG